MLLGMRRAVALLVPALLIVVIFSAESESALILSELLHLIQEYGHFIVLIGSFLEATIAIQWLFPGGIAVLLSASQIQPAGPLNLYLVIAFGTLGAMVGYVIDFYLGRVGYIIDAYPAWLTTFLKKAKWKWLVAVMCFHPNAAAPVCWLIGQSNIGLRDLWVPLFFGQLFWSTFWSLISRAYGNTAILWILDNRRTLAFVGLFIYSAPLLLRSIVSLAKRRQSPKSSGHH